MCGARLEAHHEAMFNSYEMTRAFVAERQTTLRHEARQHRLGRAARRQTRRTSPQATVVRLTAPADPASPAGPSVPHRQAA